MGFWSFYFLAKLGLHLAGAIELNWWLNLLFAVALLWSPPPRLRRLRQGVAVVVAIALLWHDSHWPSPWRVIEEWRALSAFSADYVAELVGRVVSWQVVGALLLGAGLHALLSRRLRLGAVAIVGLLAVPLLPWVPGLQSRAPAEATAPMEDVARRVMQPNDTEPATPAASAVAAAPALDDKALNQLLARFYQKESEKGVGLPSSREGAPGFDLVFLSVCSLAWDDLATAGVEGSSLLRRFDLVFRQFNSAASYSGPAVLRLLHGSCGQGPQHALYEASPQQCYLFRQLEQAGYDPALLLNHDGHFDHFSDQLRQQGGMGLKPMDNRGAPVAMHAFDGTPIFGDYDLLARWWNEGGARKPGASPRAVLYNTISLHDGNRIAGYGSTSSTRTWKPRAEKLFADFERFFALVEQSGRPTVVVLIPEHGAAIHGDAMQIPGLREYPTPRITHVPAGVALLGFGERPAGRTPVVVDQVSSYTALVGVVAALLRNPHDAWNTLERVAREIPPTQWVAENDQTIVVREDGRLYLRGADGRWNRYAQER